MSLDNFLYSMPVKVVYGKDSLKDIATYVNSRKVLLITSKSFIERGLVDRVSMYIDDIVDVIYDVKSHPEFADVRKIYERAHQSQFELILSIGGGSVMDVAKFVSVYNSGKSYQFVEDLTKGKTSRRNYNLIPIISIPTTAGTGSEVTPYSTIWDMSEKKKYSLTLPDLFSEVAIYDPVLTLTVPRDITIQTGLDALSHSLESIWNKNANPITIQYAIKSAKLIMENLVQLSNNLDNLEYRANMMKACMYAGLAFSNTQTAAAHAMSYYVTAYKGIVHGVACSFTLPILMDNVIGEYKFIDEAMMEIFGDLSSSKIRALLIDLGVAIDFSDYGINPKELEEIKNKIKQNPRLKNSLALF